MARGNADRPLPDGTGGWCPPSRTTGRRTSSSLGRVPLGPGERAKRAFIKRDRCWAVDHWNVQGGRLRLHHHPHERKGSAGAMLMAAKGIVVAVFVVVLAGLLIIVPEGRMMLQPMGYRHRHMRPLVQIQYAKCVKTKGEDKEGAAHRVSKVSASTSPHRMRCRPLGTLACKAKQCMLKGHVNFQRSFSKVTETNSIATQGTPLFLFPHLASNRYRDRPWDPSTLPYAAPSTKVPDMCPRHQTRMSKVPASSTKLQPTNRSNPRIRSGSLV